MHQTVHQKELKVESRHEWKKQTRGREGRIKGAREREKTQCNQTEKDTESSAVARTHRSFPKLLQFIEHLLFETFGCIEGARACCCMRCDVINVTVAKHDK